MGWLRFRIRIVTLGGKWKRVIIIIIIIIITALYSPLLRLARFFSFLILYTVGRTHSTGNQPAAGPLPKHRKTQTQNKRL
jgi:hypothetical protein